MVCRTLPAVPAGAEGLSIPIASQCSKVALAADVIRPPATAAKLPPDTSQLERVKVLRYASGGGRIGMAWREPALLIRKTAKRALVRIGSRERWVPLARVQPSCPGCKGRGLLYPRINAPVTCPQCQGAGVLEVQL
jgi:hypothetical protein